MKKSTILILLAIPVVFFFTFFNLDFNKDDKLNYINDYKSQIKFEDFKTMKYFSNESNYFEITFNDCPIDSNNQKEYSNFSKRIALDFHNKFKEKEIFEKIKITFNPINNEGKKISELITILNISHTYTKDELNEIN